MAAAPNPRWTYLALGYYLLVTIQAFDILDRLLYGEWVGKAGDKLSQGINILMMIVSVTLFIRGFRRFSSFKRGIQFAFGLSIFLLLSASWSVTPGLSMRQAILYLFVVLGAAGIVGNFDADEYMNLLAHMCALTAVASLSLLIVSPRIAFGESGDFRGIFSQKNVLGEAMTVGALAALHGLRMGKRGGLRTVFLLATMIGAALKASSATSCLIIVSYCTADTVITIAKKGGMARMFAFFIVTLAFAVVIIISFVPDAILETMGKDPTMTGRTDIWALVLSDIGQKPWLGWGYLGFWSPVNPAAMEISNSLHWFVPQAHNGLLEMLLNIGLIGAGLLVFLWCRTVLLALQCMRTGKSALAISWLLLCAGIMVNGITETVLIDATEATTSIFFIAAFSCERTIWLYRRQRRRLRPSIIDPEPHYPAARRE